MITLPTALLFGSSNGFGDQGRLDAPVSIDSNSNGDMSRLGYVKGGVSVSVDGSFFTCRCPVLFEWIVVGFTVEFLLVCNIKERCTIE